MKKVSLLSLLFAFVQLVVAQYVTPGNGTTYTLSDLVAVSGGTVQQSGANYLITDDLTISATDILSIQEDAVIVGASGKRVYIDGLAQINPPTELLVISEDTVNLSTPFLNFYLRENASNSVVRNVHLRYCCGIKVVDAQNVLIENCTFYRGQYKSQHGSGAIALSDCNPVIRNCSFVENVRSAINSPSNGAATPVIEGCYLYHNCTDNGNYPQINMGPASATDTLFIRDCYIEGHVNMSGAISLSTMIGGTILAVLENNEIIGNRYGVNQYGNDILLFARNNRIIDNNLETNPNNGGSGITVYSSSTTTKLYATGNFISGNLWGITLVGNATANLGNPDGIGVEYNIGHNILINNTNGGVEYDLYNNTANAQVAKNNYWGFATAAESEAVIWHQPDISSLGLVSYEPIWVPADCIGGTKNIPGDFATLTEAVAALNSATVCEGGVTFVLQNGTTYLSEPLTITATGTLTTPIVFTAANPEGEQPIIRVTATADNQSALTIAGGDYITISHLNIVADNELLDNGIALVPADGTNGCQHNTIAHCTITMTKIANETHGIDISSVPTAITGSNSFNHITNNVINNCYIAVNFDNDQTVAANFDEHNIVSFNELTDLAVCGVYAYGQKGMQVFNNYVSNLNETGSTNPAGMSFACSNPNDDMYDFTMEVYDNVIENIHTQTNTIYGIYFAARRTNAAIWGNIIRDIKTQATDNSTANGITIIANSSHVSFYNNMLMDMAAAGCAVSNAPATRGVVVSTCESVSLYFNTVVLDYVATNTAHQCAPLFIHGNTTPYILQNNIFANYVTLPEGSTGRVVAYFKRNNTLNTSYINPLCNNNLYYAGEPAADHLVFYGHHNSSPLADQTIAAFQERMAAVAPTLEQNSISENPPLVNPLTDLHIIAESATALAQGGIAVEGITIDIDGNPRNPDTPDIGADEFSGAGADCIISALPYFEGFEGDYPTHCWSMVYGDGAGNINPMMHVATPVYEGSQSFRFASMDQTSDFNQYLITPEIAVDGDFALTFYYAKHTYGGENFKVGYSMSSNDVTSTDFVWSNIINATSTDWTEYEQMMPAGTKYIAIHYCSDYQYYLYIDAFSLTLPPSCPKPQLLTASPSATTAILGWTENGNATTWEVEYGTTGFAIGTGTLLETTTNPLTISGLTPVATYDFYVRSVCGAGETSEWSSVATFTTLCEALAAPFTEDFSADGFPYGCWGKKEGLLDEAFAGVNPMPVSTTQSKYWNRVTYSCGLTGEHAKVNIYGMECKSWMITPVITIPANSVLEFDAAFTKYAISETSNDCGAAPTGSITDDRFAVIISTDGGNTWLPSNATIWSGTQLLNIPESGTRITIDLSDYVGDICVAFYAESVINGGDNDLHIDNIYIGESTGIVCEAPTNLVATPNATDITLTWTAVEDAVEYQVLEGTNEIATVSTTSYTHQNLAAGNHCYTVKTVCVNGLSEPSNQACATIDEPPAECVAPRLLGEAVIYNDAPAVYLWWEAVEGAVGYNVYHSGALLGSTTQIAINITGANEGETYCFTVTSLCGSDESDHSNEVCVTIPGNQQVCEPPTDLVANAEGNHVLLEWTAVEDAIAYRVYVDGTEIALVPENNYVHTGMEAGTYCYTVRSFCSYGESNLSDEVCIDFINAIDEQDGAFSIYPNPANTQVTVSGEDMASVAVYNLLGQQVESYPNVVGNILIINTTRYESGVYLLHITTANGMMVKKRIVIAK